MNVKKIFISSGEASGDTYASALIKAIKEKDSEIKVFGMGGSLSKKAGMNIIIDSEANASVMGFTEILEKIGSILKSLKTIKLWIKNEKPDAIILIDFPDFNFKIAKYASNFNIPVFYFIPPQVWAWRKGRIKFLKKYIKHSVVIYPFEEKFYKENGYKNVSFLGHPFLNEFEKYKLTQLEKENKIKSWGLNLNDPIVSIFPGSRTHEIKKYLNLSLDVFNSCKEKHKNLQGIISVAPSFSKEKIQENILNNISLKDIKIIQDDAISIMQCSNAGLQKSGTNNFQACICELPFLMFYDTSKFMAFILKHFFLLVSEFSIVNIIRKNTIKEFVQTDLTKENLENELEKLLFNEKYRKTIKENFKEIKNSFYKEFSLDVSVAKKAIDLFFEKI